MRADGVHVLEESEELIQPLRYRADIKEKEWAESLWKAEATKARTVVKPARDRPMRSVRMVVVAKEQEPKKQEPKKPLREVLAKVGERGVKPARNGLVKPIWQPKALTYEGLMKPLGNAVAAEEDETTELLNNAAQEECCFEEVFPGLSA